MDKKKKKQVIAEKDVAFTSDILGRADEEQETIETSKSVPEIKDINMADEFEKFRTRTKDAKLKIKADEIHAVFMAVKPGPITIKPSGGWLSYLSGKIRFGALGVQKKQLKVHSLELKGKKNEVEIIKITADDKVPIEKIKLRAEGFIADKLARTEAKD